MELSAIYPFVALLQRYYAGAFRQNTRDDWRLLSPFLEEAYARKNPKITSIIKRIVEPAEEDATQFEYVFNRLFVGPERLYAAPYETVYVSDERSLMGFHTMSVRSAYRSAGFEPLELNRQPDDHLALELAFIERMIEENKDDKALEFIRTHLGQWHSAHISDVREHAANDLCFAFADLLDEVCAYALAK